MEHLGTQLVVVANIGHLGTQQVMVTAGSIRVDMSRPRMNLHTGNNWLQSWGRGSQHGTPRYTTGHGGCGQHQGGHVQTAHEPAHREHLATKLVVVANKEHLGTQLVMVVAGSIRVDMSSLCACPLNI